MFSSSRIRILSCFSKICWHIFTTFLAHQSIDISLSPALTPLPAPLCMENNHDDHNFLLTKDLIFWASFLKWLSIILNRIFLPWWFWASASFILLASSPFGVWGRVLLLFSFKTVLFSNRRLQNKSGHFFFGQYLFPTIILSSFLANLHLH